MGASCRKFLFYDMSFSIFIPYAVVDVISNFWENEEEENRKRIKKLLKIANMSFLLINNISFICNLQTFHSLVWFQFFYCIKCERDGKRKKDESEIKWWKCMQEKIFLAHQESDVKFFACFQLFLKSALFSRKYEKEKSQPSFSSWNSVNLEIFVTL